VDAKLFEERTVFTVATPARVERIGFAPDFQMPTELEPETPTKAREVPAKLTRGRLR
jgi:hypothetical protein